MENYNECVFCLDNMSEFNCSQCTAHFHIKCIQKNYSINHRTKCPQCNKELPITFYLEMANTDNHGGICRKCYKKIKHPDLKIINKSGNCLICKKVEKYTLSRKMTNYFRKRIKTIYLFGILAAFLGTSISFTIIGVSGGTSLIIVVSFFVGQIIYNRIFTHIFRANAEEQNHGVLN